MTQTFKTKRNTYFEVEHDMPAKPFESIASSIGYLKKSL